MSSTIISSSTNKKHSARSKKAKHSITDSSALERRSWEAWGQREECIFFDSLVRNSRNWGAIANDIGSKRSEQVRTYYYRVLRKISRLLQAVHFNFDNRDRINTLIALLAYWEAKCETQYEESSIEFADAIKDRILRQRQELDMMRSKRHPTPEKLTVQLVPSSEEVAAVLVQAGHNPKLQLTLKSKKSMANIVEHLNSKWVVMPSGQPVSEYPLRLYVPEKLGHAGFSIDSHETTILSVFHSMNCPAICRLEYSWDPDYGKSSDSASGSVLPGHEHQELHSTSDEASDELSTDSAERTTRSQSPNRNSAQTQFAPHALHAPSRGNSPRAASANRLAVPENIRGSSKALSEDALDDDAIRQGQLLRKASKLAKTGGKPYVPSSSSSSNTSHASTSTTKGHNNTRSLSSRSPSPPASANASSSNASNAASNSAHASSDASAPARSTRYSMRSRTSRTSTKLTGAPTASSTSNNNANMNIHQNANASGAMMMMHQGQHQYASLADDDEHSSSLQDQEMDTYDASGNVMANMESTGARNTMRHHPAHQSMHHHQIQPRMLHHSSSSALTMSGLMSADSDSDFMSGDSPSPMYGDDDVSDPMVTRMNELEQLEQMEPLPPMEYGFAGGYVDATFDSETGLLVPVSGGISSSSNASGVSGPNSGANMHGALSGATSRLHPLSHAPSHLPTMIVNNHYYHPTWDHSQSYFMGATAQHSLDPYYAAYPTPAASSSTANASVMLHQAHKQHLPHMQDSQQHQPLGAPQHAFYPHSFK